MKKKGYRDSTIRGTVETAFIAVQYFRTGNSASSHPQFLAVGKQSFVVPYSLFNRPISNDTTEYHLPEELDHSWNHYTVGLAARGGISILKFSGFRI